MTTKKYTKVVAGVFSLLLPLSSFLFTSCADLDYTEATNRNEEWTYNYFGDGIKNLVFDVYAQLYNNEFESNSAYFLAGATDEAQYALATGAINNYVNGGWSPANPYSNTWTKSYTAIADANMYLEKIDQTDISDWKYNSDYQNWIQQMELFPYELRFLRAYFYFELFKTYGDVPLVTTTLTNGQANNMERTPADQIVKFIVDECDAVAPYLPTDYNTAEGCRGLQVYPRQRLRMGTEARNVCFSVGKRCFLQQGNHLRSRTWRKQQLRNGQLPYRC